MSDAHAAATAHMEALRLRSNRPRTSSAGRGGPASRQQSSREASREPSLAVAASAPAGGQGSEAAGGQGSGGSVQQPPVSQAPVEDLGAAKVQKKTVFRCPPSR